jgi:hypothetical protein
MQTKVLILALSALLSGGAAFAQMPAAAAPVAAQTEAEKQVIELSRQKWLWMAQRDTAALDGLIHAHAIFVHMGATMSKSQELEVIKGGRIQYKETEIQEVSAKTIGDTVIVLSRIQLFAIVGGNEARNPFMVTETFVKQADGWKLGALAFTRRINP